VEPLDKLIDEMLQGSRVALARLLTHVENRKDVSDHALSRLSGRVGHALRIGITGPPGAGKSTLVAAYGRLLRKRDLTVSVIAVDPTSPFSGGALLGDRVRMNSISLDQGVFIRSLATRGGLGGLSQAAGDVADLLDAFGFDVILFETVGVGQSELEIVQYADTTVVVLVPESGDSIQAMKTGLMEIADVFVINKSDREGSDRFASDLRNAMQLKQWADWVPPIVLTVATRDEGIDVFHEQVNKHVDFLKTKGVFENRRAERIRKRIQRLVEEKVIADFWTESRVRDLDAAIQQNQSPYEIRLRLLKGSE
jgi:LAO/AO transport system kinase